MISATITSVIANGLNVTLQYTLSDDQDATYSVMGIIPIPVGWTPEDINTYLTPIIDAANYAASLKPLISAKMGSLNPIPNKVAVSNETPLS